MAAFGDYQIKEINILSETNVSISDVKISHCLTPEMRTKSRVHFQEFTFSFRVSNVVISSYFAYIAFPIGCKQVLSSLTVNVAFWRLILTAGSILMHVF